MVILICIQTQTF